MTVSRKQLDEWDALADAATPGPWRASPMSTYMNGEVGLVRIGGKRLVGTVDHLNNPADGTFIGVAREAVPLLIAEVRTLQAALGDLLSSPLMLAQLRADAQRAIDNRSETEP